MQAYKKFSTAKAKSPTGEVMQIGDLYIPIIHSCQQVEIISADGTIVGNATARSITRIGNVNELLAQLLLTDWSI